MMRRLLLLLVLLWTSGCATQNFITLEQSGFKPLPEAQTTQLVARLRKQADAIKFTKLLADVNIATGSRRDKVRQVLVMGRDNSLRFDLFGAEINQLLLFAQSSGDELEIYDAASGKRERKPLSRETLTELLKVPADVPELMLLFAGEVPLESDDELLNAKARQKGADVLAEISAGNKLLRLKATRVGARLEIQELELFFANSAQTHLSYVRDLQGVPVRIIAELPQSDLKSIFEIRAIQTQ